MLGLREYGIRAPETLTLFILLFRDDKQLKQNKMGTFKSKFKLGEVVEFTDSANDVQYGKISAVSFDADGVTYRISGTWVDEGNITPQRKPRAKKEKAEYPADVTPATSKEETAFPNSLDEIKPE